MMEFLIGFLACYVIAAFCIFVDLAKRLVPLDGRAWGSVTISAVTWPVSLIRR